MDIIITLTDEQWQAQQDEAAELNRDPKEHVIQQNQDLFNNTLSNRKKRARETVLERIKSADDAKLAAVVAELDKP